MVLIRDCDKSSRVISPTNSEERDKLRKYCLKHETHPNRVIDWEVYELGLNGDRLFGELSTDSDSGSGDGSDSDCVFLYSTPGLVQGRDRVGR